MKTPLNALIIEDSADDAELVLLHLEQAGWQVTWRRVDTESAFRAALDEAAPDIVISDYNLPKFNCYKALELLQESGRDIPFIVVSGTIGDEAAVSLMKAGAHDYVLKKNLVRLAPAIERELAQAESRRERKHADEALRQSREQISGILASTMDAIITMDEHQNMVIFNHAAEIMFGCSARDALGKSIERFLPESVRNNHAGYVHAFGRTKATKRTMSSSTLELTCVRADGSSFPSDISISKLELNGKNLYTAVIRDITERKQAEAQIKDLLVFNEKVINHSPIGILTYQLNGECMSANENAAHIVGTSVATLKAQNFRTLASWKKSGLYDLVEKAITSRVPVTADLHHISTFGKDIWLTAYAVIFKAKDEEHVLLTISNITERRQAEEALRASEEKYRRLTENAADIIFRFELVPEMKLTYINGAVEKITGYTPQECMADPNLMFNMIHSDDLPLMAEYVATRAVPDEPLFMRWMAKNGSMLWMESRIVQTRDESGQLLAVEGITRDMTERKKSEEKIRRQVEYLNALRDIDRAITSTFDMKVSLNLLISKSMRILEVDAAAVLLLNPVTDALEFAAGGGFKTDVIRTSSVKLGESYAGRVAQERRAIQVPNLALEPRNLFPRDFLENENFAGYYGAPLIVKGKVIGVLEIFHRSVVLRDAEWLDIFDTLAGQAAIATDQAQLFESLQRSNVELERRVAERTTELQRLNLELKHANRAKDEFLATMSHELRTPLNSILGLSETLLEQRRDPLSERQQRSLQIVESSGRHLLELINDVLDLSKIEAGKFDYYPQVIEANTLCQSSLSFVRQQAMSKFIELDLAEDPAASKLYADPRRLKQILVNLLTNAVKFTPEHGTVKLQVRSDAERNLIQFSVIDTGIGIAAEDMKKLFQPFSQVDSSLTREYEGTGLGLALVQKLTDLHGGSVEVESEPKIGSRFIVNIPWRRDLVAQEEAIVTGSQPPVSEVYVMPPTQMRGKILLAEDNVANVLTIGEYLDSHGFEVVTASDGLQAIELTEETSPELILMDIQMPALDGLEAIRKLRADPRFASTPIIALTALAMPGDRERCLEAGADEYLSKPVSLKMLVETMDRLLGAKKPKSANS